MRPILALAFAMFLSVSAFCFNVYQPTVEQEKAADRLIKSLEIRRHLDTKSEDRLEYRPTRKYAFGDVTGDKIADLVVQFQLNEGNSWTTYLAVLQAPTFNRSYHARVGAKGWRTVDLMDISKGWIETNTKYYSKTDSLCCPTVFGSAIFAVCEGELLEGANIIDCSRK